MVFPAATNQCQYHHGAEPGGRAGCYPVARGRVVPRLRIPAEGRGHDNNDSCYKKDVHCALSVPSRLSAVNATFEPLLRDPIKLSTIGHGSTAAWLLMRGSFSSLPGLHCASIELAAATYFLVGPNCGGVVVL
jgi:hypothetical protein